jgi:CubicO group peptidase (beta-lactamase class C family)
MKKAFGYYNNNLTLPANKDTIYMLTSCLKMFMSTVVGILMKKG